MEQRDPLRWLTIADVEHYYVHLATGFAIGAINSEEYRVAMEAFKFRDDSHRYWTIGASSGQWFVFDDGNWVSADPPPELLGPDVPLLRLPDDLLESVDLPAEFETDEIDLDGADLPADAVLLRVRCSSCGGELEPEGAFCPTCGASTM